MGDNGMGSQPMTDDNGMGSQTMTDDNGMGSQTMMDDNGMGSQPMMDDGAEMSQNVRDGFKRLFPNYDPAELKYPLRTEVMVTMCNIVQYAFGAYDDPNADIGHKEDTVHGPTIQHLN